MYYFFSHVSPWRIVGGEFNGISNYRKPTVSTANMSDLRLEGKELSVSGPFGVYAKVEKKGR